MPVWGFFFSQGVFYLAQHSLGLKKNTLASCLIQKDLISCAADAVAIWHITMTVWHTAEREPLTTDFVWLTLPTLLATSAL